MPGRECRWDCPQATAWIVACGCPVCLTAQADPMCPQHYDAARRLAVVDPPRCPRCGGPAVTIARHVSTGTEEKWPQAQLGELAGHILTVAGLTFTDGNGRVTATAPRDFTKEMTILRSFREKDLPGEP